MLFEPNDNFWTLFILFYFFFVTCFSLLLLYSVLPVECALNEYYYINNYNPREDVL